MVQIKRKRLFWSGAALFVVGLAFLVLPPYGRYCEGDQANNYYCAAYGVALTLGNMVETHNGAITALATIAIAAFTLTLWQTSKMQGDLAQKSIDLARDDFNATHRPWLPITKFEPYSGLNWAGKNALIGFTIFCRNTGNSPAQRVNLRAAVFPFITNEQISEEIEKLKSRPLYEESRALIERTLFPTTEDLQLSRVLLIRDSQLSELKDGLGEPATEMVPVILGCIEYYFSFGNEIPHYTPFAYHVWRTHRTQPSGRLALPLDGQSIGASDIILVDLINAGDPT